MTGTVSPRIQREIRTFARQSGAEQVILFGSRARGTNGMRSDIELAVRGGNADLFAELMSDKLHSLLKADVVKLTAELSEDLQREIERDGIVLYEKSR